MYAIIGITGHVGRVTASLLLKNGLPVRAIVRNPAKAEEWERKGVDVVVAALHETKRLEAAFKDTEGVFVMTPPLFDSVDPMADHNQMLDALYTALQRARPKKVVYLSSIGAHLAIGTGAIKKLYDMEQVFSNLVMPSAAIRAAWFMENFAGGIDHARKGGKLHSFIDPADLALPMVAVKDIGKLAAGLLEDRWSGHRILELEGPCRYSASDVAYALTYQLDRQVVAEVIPAEQYEAIYESLGFTSAASKMMAEMNRGFNSQSIVFEGAGREQVSGETLLEDVLKSYTVTG